MKKFTKEQLMTRLNESSHDIDELADYKKMKGLEKSWEPIMSEPQDDDSFKAVGGKFRSGKAKGKLIGHKIMDKTTNEPLVIFYPCDKNIDEFLNENSAAIEALKKEYGDFYISKSNTIPTCQPRTTAGDKTLYKPSGEEVKVDTRVRFEKEMSDTAYIKRYLIYPLVSEILGDDVNEHLTKSGIPVIKTSERAFLDRHSKVTNDQVIYQTMNFNSYENPKKFFDSAVRRVQGKFSDEENEYREYHMARQFNKLYRNWDKYKKLDPKNYGLTDIYNLEKYGYSLTNLEVSVSSLFKITGRLVEQFGEEPKYVWEVSFKTEHGKVLKDNETLRKLQLNNDYDFEKREIVEVEQIDLTKKDAIAKNDNIVNGLKNALLSIKEDIMSIPVNSQLKRAKLSSFQLTPQQKEELMRAREEKMKAETAPEEQPEPGQMNESFVNKIVQSVISELKK